MTRLRRPPGIRPPRRPVVHQVPAVAAGVRCIRLIAVMAIVWGATGASPVAAQERHYFVTGGFSRSINDELFPGVGGGVLVELPGSWVSVGARGDVLFSGGYAAGRGGPIAQVALVRRRSARPFVMAGFAWGEEAGPMLGAGIDVWSRGRTGFRASFQDYVTNVSNTAAHQLALQFGIVWH